MTESKETESAQTQEMTSALAQIVNEGLPKAIADVSALVKIPSISWSAFDRSHVAHSAQAVAKLVTDLEVFESVEILQAPIGDGEELGQPAVLATRKAKNGRPTVLLYAHHDVQPPGKNEDWDTDPFVPTVRGDRLYGRGAADDKAGVMTHVAAIRALTASVGDDFDLGLTAFIEGEEEFGSRSFANFLERNREALNADVIVVADSDNWDISTPALTVTLRGNVTFKLTVSTLAHASHSGMFGGAAPDAMMAATRLLASLHDAAGAVAVQGLHVHDGDTPEFSSEQLRHDAALLEGVNPVGTGSILSRLWYQPSITVTGIDAPSVDHASNTLLPRVAVRISVRIAPGQDPIEAYEAVTEHLRANAPFGAHLEFADIDHGQPFLVDTGGYAVAEIKQAMEDAWGSPPVETGIGGSIPFIADLVRVFPDAQILVTGVEDPDTRAHSPNESLHLGVFHRAILTEALFLTRLNTRTHASM